LAVIFTPQSCHRALSPGLVIWDNFPHILHAKIALIFKACELFQVPRVVYRWVIQNPSFDNKQLLSMSWVSRTTFMSTH